MKLTFDEKKLLYAYGNPDLALTRKRLYEVAGLTVDPDKNSLVFDFVRKLEDESLHLERWYDQMFYFVRSEMEHYTMMQKMMKDIEKDQDWGLRFLMTLMMTNSLTMCKLETMIYASEDGTYSVFTLNPDLQKQLADLAEQHPEVCCCKAKGEAGGATYQVRNAAVLIQPVLLS